MEGSSFFSLLIYAAAVIVLVAFLALISHLLGQRHLPVKQSDEPFESGIVVVGDTHHPFSIAFYLMAIFFVIFDLEVVYLFGWAIAVREVGWNGFVEALVFITVLLAALAYIWRVGALDWGAAKRYGKGG